MNANNGSDATYYDLPPNALELIDLIMHKNMDFPQGNIFKAAYRLNDENHSGTERDLLKIQFFTQELLHRVDSSKYPKPETKARRANVKPTNNQY